MNKTTTNTIIGVVVAIVIIVAGILIYNNRYNTGSDYNSVSGTGENQNAGSGRVVFSVSDAAANMGNISEIHMNVSSIAVHDNTNGWTTVSTTPRSYSLLDLNANNRSELLADAQIPTGSYDEVRLIVDSVSIKTKSGTSKTATLPSNQLDLDTSLAVNAGSTYNVNFDFMADKSTYTTTNGEYVFSPVVKTDTKSGADVSIDSNNAVTVTGGSLDSSGTAGMDVDGSVKNDFQIDNSTKLDLDTNGMIKLTPVLK